MKLDYLRIKNLEKNIKKKIKNVRFESILSLIKNNDKLNELFKTNLKLVNSCFVKPKVVVELNKKFS